MAIGGAFDRAGLKSGDIILYEAGAPQLFQMLDRLRGEWVKLTVIRPLATQPLLENCPRLVFAIEVPP